MGSQTSRCTMKKHSEAADTGSKATHERHLHPPFSHIKHRQILEIHICVIPSCCGNMNKFMPARSTRAFAHKQAEQSDINTLSRLSAIIPSLKPVCNIFFVCAFFKLGFSALDYGEETHTNTHKRRYALP